MKVRDTARRTAKFIKSGPDAYPSRQIRRTREMLPQNAKANTAPHENLIQRMLRMHEFIEPLKNLQAAIKDIRHIKYPLAAALCCLAAVNGYAQLNYLSDSRSLSGFATVGSQAPPYYVISSSGNYSASVAPSAPFADLSGSVNGGATLVEGLTGVNNYMNTYSASVYAGQTSFLHPLELSYRSFEFAGGTQEGNGEGSSSLQVSFSVSSPVAYDFTCEATGDPLACWDIWNLSSAIQGVLAAETTGSLLQEARYGLPIDYSGTFNPGAVYTLTLSSEGGKPGSGSPPFEDGGGLFADLTIASGSVSQPVPDSVATVALLGTVLCLLVAVRTKLRSA